MESKRDPVIPREMKEKQRFSYWASSFFSQFYETNNLNLAKSSNKNTSEK